MTPRQTTPRNALEPPQPIPGRTPVIATDLDRTFTKPDLQLSTDAIRTAKLLRSQGVRLILVTGRPANQIPLAKLHACFDAMVLEGGAVWGKPGRWSIPRATSDLWHAAETVRRAGHSVDEAWASFSAPAAATASLANLEGVTVHENVDRIDVTGRGVDKASGLLNVLQDLRIDNPWVLGIGDSRNDLPLAHASHAFVAVANAHPDLSKAATMVAPHEAHNGFLWAVRGVVA